MDASDELRYDGQTVVVTGAGAGNNDLDLTTRRLT